MKKTILLICICASFMVFSPLHGQQTTTNTPAQAQERIQQISASVTTLSDVLFNPIIPADPPKPNPYPLESINAKGVDATFASGLAVDATTVQHIKNFYFYLEYIVKLELAAAIATYALQNTIDVYSTLETTGWKGLVNQAITKAGSWNQLLTNLKTIQQPQFDLIEGTINSALWKDISATPFWQSIPVTTDLIIQSSFWQKYLKYEIAQTFRQDGTLITSIFNVEKRIFPYIPTIEVAYYNSDFSYIRNSSEYFRLSLILNDKIRDRSIRQSNDLKKNIIPATNQIDLIKTYSDVLLFEKDPLYELLTLADQNLETIVKQINAQDLPITNTPYVQNPMVQSELTCIAMLKNIQGQLNYLFSKQQLEKTIQVLSNSAIPKPIPSLFLYEPDDYLYLEDLATTIDQFNNADPAELDPYSKKITLGGQNDEKIVVQDFSAWLSDNWNQIKEEGKQLWSDVKHTGKDISGTAFDLWQGIEDEAKAVGYRGAALGTLLAGDPKDAKILLQKAMALQTKVANDLKETLSDAGILLDDTVSVAQDAASIGAQISGIALAEITHNTNLGDLLNESINASLGLLINLYAGMEAGLLELNGGLLYLTADALAIAADVTTKSIMDVARGNWGQLGQDVLNGLESMVADVATTLWSAITFVGKYIVTGLRDAIALIGYLTAMITEEIVSITTDILKGFASMVDSLGWKGASDALNSAGMQIESHKQVISATVTTALLVGTVFLTDGAALPLIAFTVGPQLFQVAGSWQQDEQSEKLLAEQTQFLNNYQVFVDNNEKISSAIMQTSNAELILKNKAQIINEERALGFYQNFLSQYFENTKQQMSFYLGGFLAPQLQQQEENYKLRFADVGSLYGFKTGDGNTTGVLNLNPSQGFPLYNKGRNMFAQEIAVYPAIATQDEQEVQRKFWFNQKETIPLTNDTPEVEVRWQAIYVLNGFYLGLYFGGQPLDVASMRDTKIAPIDAGHLAKMLVYKKEDKDTPVTLGLYEHEGKGWFTQPLSGPSFEVGSWYRMKMKLSDTNFSVKVWKETDQEPSWQSFTVEKTPQKTIGIISSGASVQYQIITPTIPITPVPEVRGAIDWQTEQQRSVIAQQILQQKLDPTLGTFSLQAVGKPQILKGQFLYTTPPKKDDYLILGTVGASNTIINQGISPRDISGTQPALVSLISGNAFDTHDKKITTCAYVLDQFLQAHGPLTDALTAQLQSKRNDYIHSLIGPFNFGNISLQATGSQELAQGQFIYQALSPELELRDTQGNYDYFLVLGTDNKLGAVYDENIRSIRSLVTGFEYDRSGTKKELRYLTGASALETYIENLGPLRNDLKNAIIAAANTYQKITQQDIQDRLPLGLKPVQQTTPKDVAPQTGPQQETIPTTTATQEGNPAENSLQGRTENAASDGWGW